MQLNRLQNGTYLNRISSHGNH